MTSRDEVPTSEEQSDVKQGPPQPLAEIQRQLRNEFFGTDRVFERSLNNATSTASQAFLRAFYIVERTSREVNHMRIIALTSFQIRCVLKLR